MPKKRFKISAILSLFLCLAVCITAAFSLLFLPNKTVYADRSSAYTVIGDEHNDIFKSETKTFNLDLLKNLYDALAGVDSYDELEKKVQEDGALTSANFRENNADKNVSVWFGGKKWDVVYLTTDREGKNLVLDLWQSADNVTEISAYAMHAVNDAAKAYPSSMYSTSYIRVQTLNNGGYVSTSNTTIPATPYTPKTSDNEDDKATDNYNTYARFTSSEATDSVVSYLVQPKNVAYQETENNNGNSSVEYSLVNDAYGLNTDEYDGTVKFYNDNLKNYTTKNKYADWKEDYLWLPSLAETGDSDNANQNGMWKTDVSLRSTVRTNDKSSALLRSGVSNYAHSAYNLGTLGGSGYTYVTTSFLVRPALHLNLTTASKVPTPKDITLDYSGEENSIAKAAQLGKADWYDGDIYSSSVKVTYEPADTRNAGVYDVTLEITDDNTWADSKDASDKTRKITMTVNSEKITLEHDRKFQPDNRYVYHTDDKTHALRIPAGADGAELNETYIKLGVATESDKQSLKILYHVETHKESEHKKFVEDDLPQLEKTVKNLPDNSESPDGGSAKTGWAKYTAENDTLNVNSPGGYCVFYKITADNHEELYGYFAVHIATENLKITTNGNLGEFDFGDTISHFASQDDLKSYIEEQNIISEVLDNNNESRLDKLDKKLFEFYIYQKDSSGEIVKPFGSRLDAGEYYLGVKYIEPESVNFINFLWNSSDGEADGEHPKLTINAKEVDLEWSGVVDDEAEKAKVSDSALQDYVNGFSWAYDGTAKSPTAKFTDVDGGEQQVTVTVDGEHMRARTYTANATEVKNYKFSAATKSKEFKILKAKNGWKTHFDCYPFSVGGEPDEVEAVPLFGTVDSKKYYTDATFTTEYTKPTWEENTYYVRIIVNGTRDYDGIDTKDESDQSRYTFTVTACVHNFTGQPYQSGIHGGKEQHWQICSKCGVAGNYADHTPKGGEDAFEQSQSEHWLVCADCNAEYAKVTHVYDQQGAITKTPTCSEKGTQEYVCKCGAVDPAIHELETTAHSYAQEWSHDGSSHWHECTVCGAHDSDVKHNVVKDPAHEVSCVEPGNLEGSHCDICGEVIVAVVEIPALGHNIVGEPTIQPTCTMAGKKSGECVNCHQQVELAIPALGHTLAHHTEKEATETENGNIEYWSCSVCGKCFNDGEGTHEISEANTIVPALGASGGISGGLSDGGNESWISRNWLWILVILVAAFMAAIILIIILSARRRRKDRQMFEMYMRSQKGGYQPLSSYMDNGRPVVVLQAPPTENGQLQLPQAIDEETLANAIALAMQKLQQQPPTDNSASSKNSNKSVHDADGFYENYKPDDDNNE